MATPDDAEEPLRSTNAKANFLRLTRLLMCGGVRLLRETFDSIHSPADLPVKLADPVIQAQLRGARLTHPERVRLHPSPGVYGTSSDFDITLLFKLFRTICNLAPPPGPRGWDDLPNSTDHSLAADLVRIKYYRNEIYGHGHTMEISDMDFVRLWKEISEILLRVATNVSPAKRDEWKKSICYLLRNPLTTDEEMCIEELEKWYFQDVDVKYELKQLREELRSQRHAVVIQIEVVNNTQIFLPQAGYHQAAASEPTFLEAGAEAGFPDDPEPNNLQDRDIWTVILSFQRAADLFLRYLRTRLHLFVRGDEVGSWHITVEYSSLQVLEGLWDDYRSGHLNSVAQEILITPQVLEKLGLTVVKLRTFISEDQYEKGKKLFEASSGAEDKGQTQSAFQATFTEAISEGSIEPEALLARISILKQENVELKEKVKDVEEALQSERERMSRIVRVNLVQEYRCFEERIPELQLGQIGLRRLVRTDREIRSLEERTSKLERKNQTLWKMVEDNQATERLKIEARISKLEQENETWKLLAVDKDTGSLEAEALLARISILRQEHFELKENVKDVEEALRSEREALLASRSILRQEHFELKEIVKDVEEELQSEREALLARKSILRQEHFELKENVKDVEEALQSERGNAQKGARRSREPIVRKFSGASTPKKEIMQAVVLPRHQEQKEGSRVEFKCYIFGELKGRYQWFKEDSMMDGQRNSSLVLDPVKMEDFGNYKCEVKYDDADSVKCVTSLPAELDIVPREGMERKCLTDVDLNIQEMVGNLLIQKKPGIRTWKQLATRYTMQKDLIVSLEISQETAGKEVIEFLARTNPKLTVYEICKELKDKDIRRFDIVEVLLPHLSTPISGRDVRV